MTTSTPPAADVPPYHSVGVLRREQEPWLVEELAAYDPAVDNWASEVFVLAAERTLGELAKAIVEGGPFRPGICAPGAHATMVTDDLLTPLFSAGGTRAVAWETSDSSTAPTAPVDEALRVFMGGEANTDRRVEFEIYSVTLGDDHTATTNVLVIGLARVDGRWSQTNGRWRVTWLWDRRNDAALISDITTTSLRRTAVDRKMFTDCTESVLGSCQAFTTQLRYGPEHWLTCVDRISHIDISGRSGLAVGDVDGDGLDDVYVAQNGGLPNLLFRHEPDGTVKDISAQAGVDFLDYTAGVLIVDIDNDGDSDLLAATGNRILVLYNNGQARFAPGASLAASDSSRFYMVTAADFDNDGDLDVYGCRYHDSAGGMRIPVPYHDANNGPANVLWRNDGDRTFTDVTVETGLDVNNRRFSFAACWEDYDRDGDMDLYVSNDFGRNNLYRNDGGTFVDAAEQAGAEDLAAGMGVTWSDFDLDGDTDLYVSNMYTAAGMRVAHQPGFRMGADADDRRAYQKHARGNTLLANNGDGTFVDVTAAAGVARGHWSWGALFVDFNNDGLEDLYVPSGFISNQREGADLQSFFWRRIVNASPFGPQDSGSYKDTWAGIVHLLGKGGSWAGFERNTAFLNCGGGRFVDVSALTDLDFADDGRAVASVDWDGDLDLDLWIMSRTGPQLRFARNDYDHAHRAIAIRLIGVTTNRDAIGGRVELNAGANRLSRTVYAGSGFVAQSSKWLHFGLGKAREAADVVVFWPGGERQSLGDLVGDKRYVVEQGGDAKVVPSRREAIKQTAAMRPSVNEPLSPVDHTRTVLLERLTVPPMEHADPVGNVTPLRLDRSGGMLLIAWSGQSRYSLELLTALADHRVPAAPGLADASLEVVALCADRGEALQNSMKWFQSLGATFEAGVAPRKALAKLLVVKWAVLSARVDELVLPTSYLIDQDGKLAVLYEGKIDIDRLLADSRGMRDRNVDLYPFEGRWLARPERDLVGLARFLADAGLTEVARTYLDEHRNRDR